MWNNQGGGSYDQQGFGDQGGGYLNNTMGSPSGSQEKRSRQRLQNITPVTFAQVINCDHQDDQFRFNGVDMYQVTAVGLVREVNETPTRLDYKIDDMTGPPMEVKQFVETNDDGTPDEKTVVMRENTYVRLFGHVRSFNNKRSIVAFKMQPITDMNELTNHILETIHSQLYHTKGSAAGSSSAAPASTSAAASGSTSGGAMEYSGAQPDQGLTPVQNQVYTVIRSCQDEQGVSISYISERVKGPTQKAIKDAIEFLSGEGHIYSTIDDEHFKSTDGM